MLCENDENIEGHCAVEDIDYCLHEHFPTPGRPRNQGPLEFSIFRGYKHKFLWKKYNNLSVFYMLL